MRKIRWYFRDPQINFQYQLIGYFTLIPKLRSSRYLEMAILGLHVHKVTPQGHVSTNLTKAFKKMYSRGQNLEWHIIFDLDLHFKVIEHRLRIERYMANELYHNAANVATNSMVSEEDQ